MHATALHLYPVKSMCGLEVACGQAGMQGLVLWRTQPTPTG